MKQFEKADKNVSKEIDLVVPVLTEMVRVVRLTVSGIASTIGFEIDTIEDIKVAVAEVCNRIITKTDSNAQRYIIKCYAEADALKIRFFFEDQKPQDFELFDDEDVFGVSIINALVDEVSVELSQQSNEIIALAVFLKESEV